MTNTQPHDSGTPGSSGAGPGTTPPSDESHTHWSTNQQGTQSSGLTGFFDQLRGSGIRRSRNNWIAGVCSGLARRLNVDPAIIRAAAIVLLLLGIGILLYLIAWAFLPDEDGSIVAERAIRDGDGGGIFLLVIIGLILLGTWVGDSRAWAVPTLLVAAVLGYWYIRSNRSSASSTPAAQFHTSAAAGTQTGSPQAQPGSAPYSATPQQSWHTGTASSVGYEPPPTQEQHNAHHDAHRGAGADGSDAYRRPKAPRTGLAGLLLVLGAIVVGWGIGIAVADSAGVSATLGGLFGSTILAGLATVILGLLGRRSFLASLASIALAVSLVTTWSVGQVPTEGFGEQTWRPTSASEQTSYTWSMGSAELDLRQLTEAPAQRDLRAQVSFGELVVYVPEGITTRINASTQFGAITVDGTEDGSIHESNGGTQVSRSYVFGEGEPELTVNASARFGSLKIITTTDPTSTN